MDAIALKDNKTMKITKGKHYTVWCFNKDIGGQLVSTVNDMGDSVVMLGYDFAPAE